MTQPAPYDILTEDEHRAIGGCGSLFMATLALLLTVAGGVCGVVCAQEDKEAR